MRKEVTKHYDGRREWFLNRRTGVLSAYTVGGELHGQHYAYSEAEGQSARKAFARKERATQGRKAREQVMRDCGLVKVRGELGGVYWE